MKLNRFLAVASLVAPCASWAQGQCSLDMGKPSQVKDASSALTKASLFQNKPDQLVGSVREAFAKVTKDEAKVIAANPAGRAMIFGQAFVELSLALPNGFGKVPKTSIGLVGDGDLDLVAAADSMFDVVDALGADCRTVTEEYRRRVYAKLVNDAVNTYNAQQVDSALALANRSLVIYDGFTLAHVAYNIQGNARQTKNDFDGAVESFIKMTDLMKGDTTQTEERRNTMGRLAEMLLDRAKSMEDGDAKKATVARASSFLQKYVAEFPNDVKANIGLSLIKGDSAAARKTLGGMASSSDAYSDMQLFDAGVVASRAEFTNESAALFEAGLKKNPYSRDGLFNTAIMLQKLERFPDSETYLRRLLTVDPENPEAYQLMALNYRGYAVKDKALIDSLRKSALAVANDKKTTMAQKNAAAASIKAQLDPIEVKYKAENDSLLKYFNRNQNAKAKVGFTLWSHDGTKHVLAGSVENLSEAPADYTIKFEFIDAAGKVILTKDATVSGVAPKGQKSFRLETEGAGIIAFKYAPFSGS